MARVLRVLGPRRIVKIKPDPSSEAARSDPKTCLAFLHRFAHSQSYPVREAFV